ncbi:protein SIEVE ELEMENT OCCLUSION B-like [Rhododendron vialii]|uniref:protein SIEVE ELEMENT OCCLUSION B-like n=1 Tax=Rhododendron vialii TaxID=182163 RepID=UPI00265D7064|nr:protein SIEVE ELEMENT OCCLUSION B-like [Rhododendron vialii]
MAGKLILPGSNPSTQQLIKGDRSMFMTSDDNVMLKQIQATHNPDGRDIDVKPILNIVEDILSRATMTVDSILPGVIHGHAQSVEDKAQQTSAVAMLDALSYIIDRISCEIAYKSFGGEDGHQTTVSLLNMLSNYSWDAKLVLTLAAFALHYGEFWLLAQIYSSNQLAKAMAILKQLPIIMEHSGPLKPKFDALNNLIRVMLDLTRCIVAFKELPSAYFTHDVPALAAAANTIPTAVYWAMRGVVACAAQISSLTSIGHEYGTSTMEAWELSTLAHKINNIYEHLSKQLNICNQLLEERRNNESYDALRNIFEMIHIDNMKVLKALIYARDDQPPLFDGSTKRRVNLEVLRRKNVLLLISSLDISPDELSILEQIYNESRQHATRLDNLYEVVWIPIVDRRVQQWTDPMQKQFESLQSTMPWYSVHHPSLIDRAVIRFVKERWHFRNKPILVVLDPQGRVVSPNAIHMMWIWGSNAFPFTSLREENLWKEETWKLELLVNGIDQTVLNWIRDEKYIFVYGGDDIEWIRRFTTTARSVAQSARIPLEMVYVGKSSKKEQVRKIVATITNEKLSHTWQDLMIWFFWTRLESMLFSKIQLGRLDDQDPMMQEIKKLLSYDKSGGWAVLSRGAEVVVNGHGTKVMPTLLEYDLWKEHVATKGFDRSFKDHHDMLHGTEHPCCRFEFLSTAGTGRIPEGMKCPECLRAMEKYITFCCCHDENPSTAAFY